MSLHDQYDAGNEKEADNVELSGSENEVGFDEDMEALKKACLRTGTNLNDLEIASADNERPSTPDAIAAAASAASTDSGSDDDLEIFRSIRDRLALPDDVFEPLCTVPPIYSSDEDAEDDFKTLRVIQNRLLAYSTDNTRQDSRGDDKMKVESTAIVPLEDATGNDICENFQDYEQTGNISHVSSDNVEMQQSVGLIQWDQSDVDELSASKSLRFPKTAQLLFDAIKKNRSYQKFLRSKLTQIEVKIEENKKLKERVKILRDFQVSCKKITGRALSTKKDPRIQLISSARKSRYSKDPEVNDKRLAADYGPPENSSVASYRTALIEFPLRFQRKKWSREERENLGRGIRQQFQERALQVSVDWLSTSDGLPQDGNNLDDIIASVNDLEITPERIREFLPNVDWDQLASFYVKGRHGAECETRWLNHEDPLINRNPWTAEEDKNLLLIAQERGICNWLEIAVLLGSNRTPFQCLARYQRSLNVCILKREWTKEEDDQLRIAVEVFGECDWQSVASTLKGRTGTQCSNRWKKSLHPTRQRVGRWTRDEDKRLKVAVMLFGPKNWRKIADVVPGRTQVQCRERWVNSLDPVLNLGVWTEEEDSRLETAIEEHGYCWSKIATCMASRTDNQCWRRWKMLHPEEVPLLREARKIRKATLITNFVDRESERPALGPNDFNIQLPMITATSEPENTNLPNKEKRKRRERRPGPEKENAALRLSPERRSRKNCRKGAQDCSVEVPLITNENEAETASGRDSVRKNRRKQHLENNNCTEPAQEVTFKKKRKREPTSGNNDHTVAQACSVEVPLITNENEAETASGCDSVRKNRRKQHLENNNCTEPAQDVTFKKKRKREPTSGNNDHIVPTQHVPVQKKRRQSPSRHSNCSDRVQDDVVQTQKRKQQSESSKCIKPVQDNSSSQPLSTLCMTTNHEAESFASSPIKRRKNPKALVKQCSKRSVHSKLLEKQHSICSENSVFSGGDDGAEVMQNSGVESEVLGVDDASRKKSTVKPRSKRRTCMNSSTSQSSNIIVAEGVENLSASKNTKKRGSKSRKRNKPSGYEDEDDQTLACFIRNKSKKIKNKTVENAHLSALEGMDEHSKIDKIQSGLRRDGEIPENSTLGRSLKDTNMSSDTDIGVVDVIEDDIITLACLRERLKKMRATIAQSGRRGGMS